jgi:hypothetical protein
MHGIYSWKCGEAETLLLKIRKSNDERLALLTIVTKTTGSNMPAVGPGEKENTSDQAASVL